MLMVAAREILHTAALQKASPQELLRVANQRLYTPQHRLFVALLYLCLEPSGRGIYALAGQPAPLLRRVDGVIEELQSPAHRLPVGALRDVSWDLCEVQAKQGEVLLLYSDGVTDARNETGESFGEDRLRYALARSDSDPTAVVDGVMAAIAEFKAATEAYDDITLLAVRWQDLDREKLGRIQ
jgi:sigma-B regulation protein RsbU (phosphoserine phosphatase)